MKLAVVHEVLRRAEAAGKQRRDSQGRPAEKAQDQDRALVLRDYVWTLHEQQEVLLRDLFPIPQARKFQSYDKMELSDGCMIVALPGKDPDNARSEHPTLIVFDEACFIERGGEAFDLALTSRVPKVVLISTAAPSWLDPLKMGCRSPR